MSSLSPQANDNLYLAVLTTISGLGPKRLRRLQQVNGNWQASWEANEKSWQEAGIPLTSCRQWQEQRRIFQPQTLHNFLKSHHIQLVSMGSTFYPQSLLTLSDAPLLLYAQGQWPHHQTVITIVGSRQPNQQQLRIVKQLVPPLVAANSSISSGLALGIDTSVHELALAHGGHTIAILPSGLNHIYPVANRRLAHKILAKGGLLLSEYSPQQAPTKTQFLRRNRLLAAIGYKTIIITDKLNSGSMCTAKFAQQLQRPFTIINSQ